MPDEFITIDEENCNEYEFDKFSLVHNLTKQNWELHYFDEEEGELFIYIDSTSFEEEKDLFLELGFTKECFENIINFEDNKK